MSKKFSTLMASLLLASAFSANAAEETWIKVSQDQFVDGATYKILLQGKDSILNNSARGTDGGFVNVAGPHFVYRGTQNDTLWTVSVKSTGFELKSMVAGSNGLQTWPHSEAENRLEIYSNQTTAAIFTLDKNGTLKIGENFVWNWGAETEGESYGLAAMPKDLGTKVDFYIQSTEPTAPTGAEAVKTLAKNETLFLAIDGKFVKSTDDVLRAAVETGTALVLENNVNNAAVKNFTWVWTGAAFQNPFTDKYLSVNENGELIASATAPTSTSVDGGILTIKGTNVGVVALYTSSEALPFVHAGDLKPEEYLADGAYYILTANGKVVNSEGKLDTYTNTGHTGQVYQAKVVKLGSENYVVRFANKETEQLLEVDGRYVQVAVTKEAEGTNKGKYKIDSGKSFILKTSAGKMVTAELTATDAINQAILFGAAAVEDRMISQAELQSVYGASFGVTVKRAEGEKALVNNPFTGKLAPVAKVTVKGDYEVIAPTGTYMLQKENGNLIAVSPEKYASKEAATYGYKVVEISPKDLYLALNAKEKTYYAYGFQLYAPASTFVGEDAAASYILAKDSKETATTYCLGALQVSGVGIALSAEEGDENKFTDDLQIKLGTFTKIDLTELLAKPSFYQVTVKNVNKNSRNYGKVLGLNANGNTEYVKASEALVGYPETQWAIVPNNNASPSTIKFVNRENKDENYSLDVDKIYTTDRENVFSVVNGWYGDQWRDTIEIKPVATAETDGYLHLATSEWKNNLYYVGVNSSVWKGLAYVTENHKNEHKLGLDTDKDNATAWKLTAPWIYKKNALGEVVDNYQETVKIDHTLWYWSAKKNTFINTNDEDNKPTVWLTIPVYNIMNSANGEYMYWDNNSAMVVSEYWDDDDYYALKETAEGKYNLVRYTRKYEYIDGTVKATVLEAKKQKIYGGDSADKGILNLTDMYDQTENDIFSIEVAEAPEYVKLNYGDKIKIYRDEQESNVLYEKGEFAGIGNAVEFANINPALYVDTAWMNRDEVVNRYDYLLAVNAKQATKAYECNVPEHKHLYHYADTTYGRFLVNLADSAIVEDERDSHNNKFVYDNGYRYAKLAFVEAKHTGDKLIIASPKDTIEVGTPAYNLVKFAFRTVDPEAGTFVIETGYKAPYADKELEENPGYLRWINGNLVVTDEIGDAEVFSLKATENEATANEAIAAEGVQVIGGKGAVTVQGAAGKVITVANILGQTIANQVAASDNVTIAAPAGVVVVAVEGDATKVVVK